MQISGVLEPSLDFGVRALLLAAGCAGAASAFLAAGARQRDAGRPVSCQPHNRENSPKGKGFPSKAGVGGSGCLWQS